MGNKEKKRLPEPRTYTVEQIAAILNIVRIGNAIRISKKSFDEWPKNMELLQSIRNAIGTKPMAFFYALIQFHSSANRKSRILRCLIPSRLMSNSSNVTTYLGKLSRTRSKASNSRLMVSSEASR